MTSCGAGVAVFLGFAALPSLAGSLTVGTKTNTKPLNTSGCYAPSSDGGWGFCGPFSCTDNYDTCVDDDGSGGGPLTVDGVTGSWATSESDCKPFLSSSYDDDEDIQDWSPTKNCDNTCTQETSGVCSAEFLAGVLKGQGVKWAYCNDRYLFMYTDGQPTIWNANLNDVPYPPGDSSGNYRTGMDSMDLTKGVELYYPLNVTLLNTDANDNNVETWASATYLYSSLWDDDSMGDVGIPADSGIGVSVSGQMIYPIYNNVAVYTPQQCEVDSCNEHVGQGGGQPHLHGDPFGDEAPTRCLYGPSNYTGPEYGETGHPPVIGFGADGILIYGRYLYDTQLGYQAPLLDNCGGHIHSVSATSAQDPYGLVDEYHYHTQVFDATADSSAVADEDDSYSATTTGPLNCYKANISASPGSMALYEANSGMSAGKSEMENRCCDMTDYYILTGLSFPDAGSDLSVKSSSTCSSPAAPANGYHSGVCSSEGTTMYSGWTCNVTCNDGFYLNGTTQCVGGVLNEASCDSFAPSNSPTTGPTLPPTTSTPTLSPTTGTTVTVDASMTMSGLNASQVDDDDLAAIKTGLSSVLDGVDESDIYGLVVTAARRRRLTHEETRRLRTRAAADAEGAESRARQLLGSSTATVTFSVSLDTSSTSDFSSADALYTSVTSDLSDAASDSTDLITVGPLPLLVSSYSVIPPSTCNFTMPGHPKRGLEQYVRRDRRGVYVDHAPHKKPQSGA